MFYCRGFSSCFILNLLWISICISCATTNQPSTASTGKNYEFSKNVEIITLLPVVDLRKGKSISEDYTKLTNDIETELIFKGYEVQVTTDFSTTMELSSNDIANMKINDLVELGPSGSEYLFIFSLIDSNYTNAVIATSSNVEAKGRLIDIKNKRLLWEGSCTESMTALGLGETLVTPVKGLSMRKCFLNMFSGFPNKSD